jgi:parallel beta-helix repeat protein
MNWMKDLLRHVFLCAAVVSFMLMGSAQAQAETIQVATMKELKRALAQARGGETLLLAPGNYGALVLKKKNGARSTRPVVLRSANADAPAVLTGMNLRHMSHLTFEGVVFDYRFSAGQPLQVKPFKISESRHITIRNSVFDGDLARNVSAVADGLGYGIALALSGNQHVTLEYNSFYNFHRAITLGRSSDVVVRGNDIYAIRSDGINLVQTQRVVIEDNHIHDFNRSTTKKDHSDMIQMWSRNAELPSSDIIIRNNVLNLGKGDSTQSIFMRNDQVDRGLAGAEMFYRNITIENNTIINAHLHGITVGETDGLVIRNNTVVRNKSSKGKKNKPALWTPQIRVAPTARNVEITRNVTSKVVGHEQQAGWRVARNFFVQDTMETQPGFYGAVFGRASMNKPTSPASFTPKPGGPLHNANLGSSLFLPE